jgi:hypothetical protein
VNVGVQQVNVAAGESGLGLAPIPGQGSSGWKGRKRA